MRARTFAGGIALVIVGVVAGLLIGGEREAPEPAVATATPGVLTVTVVAPERRSLTDAVRVVGRTRSRDEVRIVAELPGLRVIGIEAEAGDRVRAGQTLALLDARSLDIQSGESDSELQRARGEYERARALVASQLVSREFFKQKESAYEVARARSENARLNVQRTRVVAPTAGRVVRRHAAIGDLTDGDTVLFEIAKDGVVEMEADVPESVVGRLRPGMPARVTVAGNAGTVGGEIRLIQPSVEAATGTTPVRIRLDAAAPLPVGSFAEAEIDVADIQGWAIPRSAMREDDAGHFVWRVDAEGIVRRQRVTPVLQTADSVVVAEPLGVAPIVAKAGPFLRENDRVRITDSSAIAGD